MKAVVAVKVGTRVAVVAPRVDARVDAEKWVVHSVATMGLVARVAVVDRQAWVESMAVVG